MPIGRVLSKFDHILAKLESWLLVGLLVSMVLLAVYQVAARNLFSSGLTWADAYVRITVFWIALIGALAASRSDEHIRIDLLSRLLNEMWQARVTRVISLVTALLCFVFAWYSYQFVLYEYQDGVIAFGAVPAWACEAVMPIAMLLIGLRYVGRGLKL